MRQRLRVHENRPQRAPDEKQALHMIINVAQMGLCPVGVLPANRFVVVIGGLIAVDRKERLQALPIVSMQGFVIGPYKNDGLGGQW